VVHYPPSPLLAPDGSWISVVVNVDVRLHSQIPNLMKIRPVGAEFFHAYRRTDKHEEANFSKALKNSGKGPFVRYSSKCEDNIEKYFK
jgi:hypothetical protein